MDNGPETAGSGISRGQNQLHVVIEDWQAAADVVTPLLDRVDPSSATTQLVLITPDAEAAAGIAERIVDRVGAGVHVLAATGLRRAARVQRSNAAHVVLADATVLVALLESATLKLDAVKVAVMAWVDAADARSAGALETVMAEVPKEAARVVLASAMTPAAENLVERYARRARRAVATVSENAPISLSFVSVSDHGRLAALRRVLDTLDPPSAFVFVNGADDGASVSALLRGLGYADGAAPVRAGDEPDRATGLLVLYDLRAGEERLRSIATRGWDRIVALATPRQIPSLRRIAGGMVSPLVLPEAAERARTREDATRAELRRTLVAGHISRELLALEPLFEEYDGAEVAAAALRLLDEERSKTADASTVAPKPMTRLYLNVGEMDGMRAADLAGAVINEAGISRAELGRVDVRERHSTVEVATPVANTVVAKLTGVSIRGRRVIARVDEGDSRERPARPRRDDGRSGPGRGSGPRGARGTHGPRDRSPGSAPRGRP